MGLRRGGDHQGDDQPGPPSRIHCPHSLDEIQQCRRGLLGARRACFASQPCEIVRVTPDDWHRGDVRNLVRVALDDIGRELIDERGAGAKKRPCLRGLVDVSVPSVDARYRMHHVGGGGEARVDELAAKVDSHSRSGAVMVISQRSDDDPVELSRHLPRPGAARRRSLRSPRRSLGAEAVVRLAFDVDVIEVAANASRDVAAHLAGHRADSRSGAEDGAVEVDDLARAPPSPAGSASRNSMLRASWSAGSSSGK